MWLWKYRLGLNVLIINKLINSIIRLFFQHIYSFISNLIPKTGQHFINICKFTCKNVIQNILLYTYATCVMYFTWDLEIYSSQSNIYRYAIFYHACGNITLLWWVPLVLEILVQIMDWHITGAKPLFVWKKCLKIIIHVVPRRRVGWKRKSIWMCSTEHSFCKTCLTIVRHCLIIFRHLIHFHIKFSMTLSFLPDIKTHSTNMLEWPL